MFQLSACNCALSKCSFLIFSVSLASVCSSALAAPEKPNIVFIMLDDQGVGEQQWYPEESDISLRTADTNEPIQTPAIFRLAQEGIRFTNYHSPAPQCSPAGP